MAILNDLYVNCGETYCRDVLVEKRKVKTVRLKKYQLLMNLKKTVTIIPKSLAGLKKTADVTLEK